MPALSLHPYCCSRSWGTRSLSPWFWRWLSTAPASSFAPLIHFSHSPTRRLSKMRIWTSHSPTQNPSFTPLVDGIFHPLAQQKAFEGLSPAHIFRFVSRVSCSSYGSDTHSCTSVFMFFVPFLKTLFFHLPVWPMPGCPFYLSKALLPCYLGECNYYWMCDRC